MFSHLFVGVNDLEESRKFYDAVFTASGGSAGQDAPNGRVIYSRGNGPRFIIAKPLNGEEATFANGGTIGFALETPEQVEAWHAAGVANGGTSIENPPGIRQVGPRTMFLAYLRDPIGNKLCAGAPAA